MHAVACVAFRNPLQKNDNKKSTELFSESPSLLKRCKGVKNEQYIWR